MSARFDIGFVIFPNITQLDFTGPLQVLSRLPGASTHILARTRDLVPTDCGLSLAPTATFSECRKLDLICVPGGFGVDQVIEDAETLAFVRDVGGAARHITSVCTGAFVLGAAGLLQDRRATTHWAYHHLLPRVGAIPEHSRVVRDGNVVTGGGVTAGIDFAFTLMRELAGDDVAQAVQLALEYDPAPPFDAGSPIRAPGDVKLAMDKRYAPRLAEFEAVLDRLAQDG
ncbi:MAG: DJ-1/PfpI family protein [Hyphomonadaceae bacterium]|nr:DJ-1/PfpI family protein [Hyphomonadaceae bacterium]